VIEEALRLLKEFKDISLRTEDLPLDDKTTFELLSRGLTSGVFQFESEGMRDILRRYQPERLEDLIALNALYRPGPIQGGMVSDFIERKHGRRKVTYDFDELRDLLEETFGVIVYQEQVMQIANRIAGYSLGEADLLRRAMGKKKASEMAAQRERFVEGALKKGFQKKKVIKLFELMEQFAGYGFNKSHSAAYGFVAYVTAYLKAHYPVYFMAALLSSESGNMAKVAKYITECRDMDIQILPPDFNSGFWSFAPSDDQSILFGLGAIKNLGKNAVAAIVESRKEVGKFDSLFHFAESVDWQHVNKRMLESSIKAGALDSFGGHRAQLMTALDGAVEAGQRASRDRSTGQHGLFDAMAADAPPAEDRLPNVQEWPENEKLASEKEILGIYVTGHPLNAYRDKVSELSNLDTSTLEGIENATPIALCGVLGSIARKRNREGRPWAAAILEDLKGSVDLLIFANQFESLGPMLVEDQAVMIRGDMRVDESGPLKISVNEIVPLDVVRVPLPHRVSITIQLDNGGTEQTLDQLRDLFSSKPGEADVRLRLLKKKDFLMFYDLADHVRADRDFQDRVKQICGAGSLEVMSS